MKLHRTLLLVGVTAFIIAQARAAINPQHHTRIASEQLHLQEIARVVTFQQPETPRVRRVTIVARVTAVARATAVHAGDVIVIDYVVDLDARERAGQEFVKEHGAMPGPQFLYEPDPPKLDANHEFWANLAPAATRLANVQRHAGARVEFKTEAFQGPVFVPVAAQYSFDQP